MTIIFRTQNQRPAMGLAAIALTAISLYGSNPRAGIGQDSVLPADPFVKPAATASPNAAPSTASAETVESSPGIPAAFPKSSETDSNSVLPKAKASLPTVASELDPSTTQISRGKSESDAERVTRLEKQLVELTNLLNELRATGAKEENAVPPKKNSGSTGSSSRPSAAKPAKVVQRSATVAPAQAPDPNPRFPEPVAPTALRELHPESRQAQVTSQMGATLKAQANMHIIQIARTTYKLPPGRAEALAKLLSEQLNEEIEFKVKGDVLQVTASPEDQAAISHVIGLFLRKGREPQKVPGPETTGPTILPPEKSS